MEIKIKIKNLDDLLEKLKILEAKEKLGLKQIDRYYNAPKTLKDFSKSDEALRIRSTQELSLERIPQGQPIHDITYKGAKIDKDIKARIEYVCNIENPEIMDKILQALDFKKVSTIEKNRRVFHLLFQQKKVEILIDEIQGLSGFYLEAEIMADDSVSQNSAKNCLLALIETIGYSLSDSILQSYLELILERQ